MLPTCRRLFCLCIPLFLLVTAHQTLAQTFTLAGLSADAEVNRAGSGDSGGTVANAGATTLRLGRPADGNTFAAVFVFQLPDLGAIADPFASATFSANLVTSASTFGGFNADVYGLPARDAATVLASDAFVGSLDSTDATRLADNWINFDTATSPATGTRTLSNPALVSYLNAQYASGAGAGRHVFIRLSPDAAGNTWKNYQFASADHGTTANRPTLTYTLATPPPPNTAPVLPAQANRQVEALQTLTVTNTATDSDVPAQTLTYELLQAPAGAAISAGGVITWTPSIAQANATYTFETRVTDNGSPPLSATNSFQVTVPAYVPPPNQAPVLPAQANRNVFVGVTLTVTNTATDPDLPAQTLTYELLQAPAGAAISATGVITWTPTTAQADDTYTFETRVTDNGSPPLSATNSFQVTVAPAGAYLRSLDLSTADQFFQNFRISRMREGGTSAQNGNTFSFDGVAGWGITEIYTFDLSPNDPRTASHSALPVFAPITVSFDARVTTAASGVGVEFTDPQDPESSVLAYFTINSGADSFRFFRNADGGHMGTQVGSTVSATTQAEPGGSATFVRVTVTLSVSGTTPTLTLAVPGADAVTREFSPGDFTWSQTLVSLRLYDHGQGSGTPVQIRNIEINAGGPPTPPSPPPAPVLAPVIPSGAPVAAGVNLLTVNPSFEASSVSFGNGNHSFTGWTGTNQRFGTFGTTNAGSPGGGIRAFRIEWGGSLQTATDARAAVTPHHLYELTWAVRTTQVNWPEYRPGSTTRLDFFDANGVLLKSYWGPDWRPQVPGFQTTPWETYTIRGLAPEGAVRAGVRFLAEQGQFVGGVGSREDNRAVEVDNFRLLRLEPQLDRLAVRRAPRLLQPGATAELRIHHAALATRSLLVELLDASGQVVTTGGYNVPAGRRLNTVHVPLPGALPDGDYAWRIRLLPLGGGAAVATRWLTDAFASSAVSLSSATNSQDFDADHPNLVFMGRIEDTNPKRRWLHWNGSEVRVRFSGTSLSLRGSAGSQPADVVVVLNEDHPSAHTVRLSGFNESGSNTYTLVSGLPDGVYTARIFKNDESDRQVRVDGFRVDAGRGLLRAEPLSARRLEVYGDSVTIGGNARSNYFGYAHRLGRELDLNLHVIAKGGTGLSTSFSSQDLLGNYWDRLSFPNTFNASTGLPWDFSRFTPHGVVIAAGHNDQFNRTESSPSFAGKYAEFHAKLRAQYGAALPLIATNTIISNPISHFEPALLPLANADPRLRWVHQLAASAPIGNHPDTPGHGSMVVGNATRYALADVVEEQLGWGLDAPLEGYESWALAHFSAAERAAGLHAPEAAPRGDGVPNLLRHALGATPAQAVSLPQPALDAQGRMQLSFPRPAADLTYVVETSNDLRTWSPAATFAGGGAPVEWVDAAHAAPRRFVRLRVLAQ